MFYDTKKIIRSKGSLVRDVVDEYIVLDLETTGLSPNYDEIIEFSGLRIKDGNIIEELSMLIKPEYKVSGFISNFTGITNEMLEDKPSIDLVIDEIIDFLGDSVLLGHNTHFDVNFIYDNYARLRDKSFENNYMDLLSIVRKLYPEWKNHKLSTVATNLKLTNLPTHRSMSDCLSTFEAYELCKDYLREYNIEFKSLFSTKKKLNTDLTPSKEIDESNPLFGKTVVFTGKLDKMARKDAFQLVVDKGGILANSITSKTNYLVIGNMNYTNNLKDGKSSKLKKAEAIMLKGYDLKIIIEDVFYDMVE